MTLQVRLRVWGDRACFTRPDLKVERVSYEVMTPSAARGILEAIHWLPAIRWVVTAIRVQAPIRFDTLQRNELRGSTPPRTLARAVKDDFPGTIGLYIEDERTQRSALILRDVDYLIEAYPCLTPRAGAGETPEKHATIFNRRARQGQCFHRPYLGVREFPAAFELGLHTMPHLHSTLRGTQELGWMLLDMDFSPGGEATFFEARMIDGVVAVPLPESQ